MAGHKWSLGESPKMRLVPRIPRFSPTEKDERFNMIQPNQSKILRPPQKKTAQIFKRWTWTSRLKQNTTLFFSQQKKKIRMCWPSFSCSRTADECVKSRYPTRPFLDLLRTELREDAVLLATLKRTVCRWSMAPDKKNRNASQKKKHWWNHH